MNVSNVNAGKNTRFSFKLKNIRRTRYILIKMEKTGFVDLLAIRRKDYDILWASRSVELLAPHKLPPESILSRKQIIEAVLNDPRVKLAIVSVAAAKGVDVKKVMNDACMIINEMASNEHLATVRWIGIIITKVLKRIFVSIYLNEDRVNRLKREMQMYQVQYVYAPSHRSYLDFILLSYILLSYDMALPNIASGMDFYQMFVIGELLRKTGAFYMRRSFSNDLLYKKVFSAYVMNLTKNSNRAVEFFIEGTRSRSLKSIMPKFGLLSIILEELLNGSVPDIYFVPITINYERPLEELLFTYEHLGIPKPKETTAGLFQSLSILQKPYAYGSIVFNVGEPISACQFLSMKYRKAKVLSPHTKLPSTVTTKLAYSIIEAHKRGTVLMPFNIIAMLFNERSQTHPDDPYTLYNIISDYLWCKNLLRAFGAVIHSERSVSEDKKEEEEEHVDRAKVEILNSLKSHEELLSFDSSNVLRLRERHQTINPKDNTGVKGYPLSEKTMKIAVSVINVTIYSNPILSLLARSVIATVVIGMEEIQLETSFKRYNLLRKLLSTEFAMPLLENETMMISEWEETVNHLSSLGLIKIKNHEYVQIKDRRAFSLLYNLLLPFIDTIYIICFILFEWNEKKLHHVTTQAVLIETQKRIEEAFLLGKLEWGQHPYSLSIELINTTLLSLIAQGSLVSTEKQNMYQVNKAQLALILSQLRNLFIKRPAGLYLNLALLSSSLPNVAAKL